MTVSVGGIELVPFAKKLAKEFTADDIGGLAAELSFRYFLALFPFFIFLGALGGFVAGTLSVDDPTASLMNAIGDSLPRDARSVLETQVRGVLESRNGGLLSFGIVAALWAATGAMKALIKALNRAYDVPETRKLWKSTGLALAMTVAATIGLLGSFALLVATQAFGRDIANALDAGRPFELTVRILTWPAVAVLVALAVAILYWLAPNIETPFRFISPGAVLFTAAWLAGTVAFSFYIANFASYNKTYGTLGGVVVLLTWLYLTNMVLLVGAEINALIAEIKEPELQATRRKVITDKASPASQKQAMEPPATGEKGDTLASDSRPRRSLVPANLARVVVLGSAFGLATAGGRLLKRHRD